MALMRRKVSLAVILVLIIAFGVAFFRVVAPFLMPLFLAGMTAVVCQPLQRYFLMRTKHRVDLASGLTTGVILAAIMIPLTTATLMASLQLFVLGTRVADSDKLVNVLRGDPVIEDAADVNRHPDSELEPSVFEQTVSYVNSWLPPEEQLTPRQVAGELRTRSRRLLSDLGDRSLGRAAGTTFGILAGVAGTVISLCIAILVYAMALYYFLSDGAALLHETEKLIPVHAKYQRQLLEQFAIVVRSVVVATFLAAFAQGIATTIALWFFDFEHLFLLFGIATTSALIPMLGTWLVWLPCAIVLFVNGHWIQGTLLCIYGAAFVGILDNVIRTYLLNSDTKLHPLLAFISILGGLQAMGLWGVFIGPIVASCLHALVKIFNHELIELTHERTEKHLYLPSPAHSTAAVQPEPSVENETKPQAPEQNENTPR